MSHDHTGHIMPNNTEDHASHGAHIVHTHHEMDHGSMDHGSMDHSGMDHGSMNHDASMHEMCNHMSAHGMSVRMTRSLEHSMLSMIQFSFCISDDIPYRLLRSGIIRELENLDDRRSHRFDDRYHYHGSAL